MQILPYSESDPQYYYTAQQAIAVLGLPRSTFYRLVADGRIAKASTGGQHAYPKAEIDNLARQQREGTMPWKRRSRWRRAHRGGEAVSLPGASSTPSLMRRIGRRTYFRNAPQLLPNDLEEHNRLDFQHYMLRYMLQGNYTAPIRQPSAILDVGCGTGRWAAEMAAQFPGATVIGLDLVALPTQQDEIVAKPQHNFTFVVGNILEGLPFADGTFDFTHQRLLALAIPAQRWPHVAVELARVTRNGGWVELVEMGWVRGGEALAQLERWFRAVASHRGIDLDRAARVGELLSEAGLSNIKVREVSIPVGSYAKQLGVLAETDFFALMAGLRGLVIAHSVVSAEAFDRALAAAREEVARGKCDWPMYIAHGQRET